MRDYRRSHGQGEQRQFLQHQPAKGSHRERRWLCRRIRLPARTPPPQRPEVQQEQRARERDQHRFAHQPQRHAEEDARKQILLEELKKDLVEYPVLQDNFLTDSERKAYNQQWPNLTMEAKADILRSQAKIAMDVEHQKSTAAAAFVHKVTTEQQKHHGPASFTQNDNRVVEINVKDISHADYCDLVRSVIKPEDTPEPLSAPTKSQTQVPSKSQSVPVPTEDQAAKGPAKDYQLQPKPQSPENPKPAKDMSQQEFREHYQRGS